MGGGEEQKKMNKGRKEGAGGRKNREQRGKGRGGDRERECMHTPVPSSVSVKC